MSCADRAAPHCLLPRPRNAACNDISPASLPGQIAGPERDTRSGFHFGLGERLVAPAPPGIVAVDMQQELRHWAPIGVQKADGRADALVDSLPGAWVVIDA